MRAAGLRYCCIEATSRRVFTAIRSCCAVLTVIMTFAEREADGGSSAQDTAAPEEGQGGREGTQERPGQGAGQRCDIQLQP